LTGNVLRTGEPIFKFAVGERVKVWLPGKRSGQVGMIKEAKKKVPVPFSLLPILAAAPAASRVRGGSSSGEIVAPPGGRTGNK